MGQKLKCWEAEKVVQDFSPFFRCGPQERTEVLDYFCC
jgi:hypothetical protein